MTEYEIGITFPNGSMFMLNPVDIARHRALSFREKYGGNVDVGEEIREAVEKPEELLLWLQDKMSWAEVFSFATCACAGVPDYASMWKDKENPPDCWVQDA